MKRCNNGHYYDETKHSSCPACGVPIDLGKTMPKAVVAPPPVPVSPKPLVEPPMGDVGGTRRINTPATPQNAPMPPIQQAGKTIALVQPQAGGIEPVVGWLVCIEGVNRGRDYRIRPERNFIGRSKTMHICIEGDDTISREKHAILTYNPKKRSFKIQAGESASMVYLNDEDVDVPMELKPYDTIELGRTKLKFVPFCGDTFMWDELDEQSPSFS